MPSEKEPEIVRYGEEEEGNCRSKYASAYAIIKWPDGTETCAWRSDNIRVRGTDEKNIRYRQGD